jgi:acylphosphatase
MQLLIIETISAKDDPFLTRVGLRDVRFSWQGVEYRRGVIRQGEPEDLYSIARMDDDGSVRLEIYGRADTAYRDFEGGLDDVPPLERFVFLLPKHPPGPHQSYANAWRDPEVIEHEIVTPNEAGEGEEWGAAE